MSNMYIILAMILSLVLTAGVKFLAVKFKIVDMPVGGRKKHEKPIALLGGTAIYLAFWVSVIFATVRGHFNFDVRQLFFLFLGSSLIIIFGFFDDKYQLPAHLRLFLSMIAVFLIMLGGINFDGITNPFGGTIGLDMFKIQTLWGVILPFADLLVFVWLLGMAYSTKVLDGLDGLASGVSIIGALMIAALASTVKFYQPDIRLLALIFAGAVIGFWWFNFYPAKIFLGEGGSLFLGLVLGYLAVVSGGKIATALLVMAIPVFDLARVIFHRFKNKQSIFSGDREHLHFKLVDMGLSPRTAVIILYTLAFLFGISTLILPSFYKLLTLGLLFLAMIFLELKLNSKSNIKL